MDPRLQRRFGCSVRSVLFHVSDRWTRAYNEDLAAACDPFSSMYPIGTIPLQHPRLAAVEVAKAAEVGCKGLMIGSDIPGLTLGSHELDIVWEAASAAELPVLMHPTFLEIPRALDRRGLKNAVGRAAVSATALADVVYSGVLPRHPDLVFIASHGGGSFLSLLPRVDRNHALGWSDSHVDIEEGIARLYWDSVVLDTKALGVLVDTVGADRVLLGSDAPFPWEPDPVGTVLGSRFVLEAEAAILGGTAVSLYSLDTGPSA